MNIKDRLERLNKDPELQKELEKQDSEIKKASEHWRNLSPEQQRIISRSMTRCGA